MKKLSYLIPVLISAFYSGQNCTTPTVTFSPVSTCAATSAGLVANTTATEVKWYDSATATVPLLAGNTYTTPILASTTSYWTEAYNYEKGAQIIGGKTTPGTGSAAVATASTPWGLAFTTNSDFLIESVDVFASAGGTLALELLDANFVKIAQTSVTIPTGGTTTAPIQVTVPVGFSVAGGNSYKLVARSSPSMRRDSGSNTFPYSIGTLGSITGGTIASSPTNNSTVYYFFYNWKVSPILGVCASGKVQTTVTVAAPTPAPVAAGNQTVTSTSTLADLVVSGQNLVWYSSSALTTQLPVTTLAVSGTTYYVTQTVNGCTSAATAITVNSNLGTNDLNLEKQIKIYPNPVADVLAIDSKEKLGKLTIFDISGKLLETIAAEEVNSVKINVGKYNTGKYILKIENSKGIYSYPFIKK